MRSCVFLLPAGKGDSQRREGRHITKDQVKNDLIIIIRRLDGDKPLSNMSWQWSSPVWNLQRYWATCHLDTISTVCYILWIYAMNEWIGINHRVCGRERESQRRRRRSVAVGAVGVPSPPTHLLLFQEANAQKWTQSLSEVQYISLQNRHIYVYIYRNLTNLNGKSFSLKQPLGDCNVGDVQQQTCRRIKIATTTFDTLQFGSPWGRIH